MTRIVLRIDRLRLQGIDPSEGEAVARALQETLGSALRERVDALPSAAAVVAALQAGVSGSRAAAGGARDAGAFDAATASAGASASSASAARAPIRVTAGDAPAALGSSVAQGIVRGWLP